jgi:eukaryotic-like serine/threonine-protein kinase
MAKIRRICNTCKGRKCVSRQEQYTPCDKIIGGTPCGGINFEFPRFSICDPKIFVTLVCLCILIVLVPIMILTSSLSKRCFFLCSTSTPTSSPTVTPTTLRLPNNIGEIPVPDGQPGQMIGVNDGTFPNFDIGRSAADSNDAERLIYAENQLVRDSGQRFITFAVGMAFTPPFPDLESETMLQGVYAAQKEFNDTNKDLQLRILIANAAGPDSTYVQDVANQLLQINKKQKIAAIIDWLTSANTIEAEKILKSSNIPLIAPSATLDSLTNYAKNFFRIVPPDKGQATIAADYAIHTLHKTRALVFVDYNDPYSKDIAGDFEEEFKQTTGNIVQEVPFKKGRTNFAPLVTQQQLNVFNPDLFFFTSPLISDTGNFEDALPSSGSYAKVPVMAGSAGFAIHPNVYGRLYFIGLAFADEWQNAKNDWLKVFPTVPVSPFFNDFSSDFDPNHQHIPGTYNFNRATQEAILWYDTTSVILQSVSQLQQNGTALPTSNDILNALPNITGPSAFQGVSGQIAFGTDHDPIDKALLIMVAPDGLTKEDSLHGCYVKGCP